MSLKTLTTSDNGPPYLAGADHSKCATRPQAATSDSPPILLPNIGRRQHQGTFVGLTSQNRGNDTRYRPHLSGQSQLTNKFLEPAVTSREICPELDGSSPPSHLRTIGRVSEGWGNRIMEWRILASDKTPALHGWRSPAMALTEAIGGRTRPPEGMRPLSSPSLIRLPRHRARRITLAPCASCMPDRMCVVWWGPGPGVFSSRSDLQQLLSSLFHLLSWLFLLAPPC